MTRPRGGLVKVYAVRRGRQVGLFASYEDVTRQTYGFPGAQHKSFCSVEEAEDYLREGGLHVTPEGLVMQLQPLALRQHEDKGQGEQEEALFSRSLIEMRDHALLVIEGLRAKSYTVRQRAEVRGTEIYTLLFDGACRGNPGYSGAGCVIQDDMGVTVAELCSLMPYGSTNNEAEFGAAFLGLHASLNLGIRHILIKGDSYLLIKILAGQSKVRHPRLQPYFFASSACLSRMESASVEHISREQNTRADYLANKAINDSFY